MLSLYLLIHKRKLFIAGISDNEMHHLNLNIKESVSSKRLTRLPSTTKNGAKFRHIFYCVLLLELNYFILFPIFFCFCVYMTVGLKYQYQHLKVLITYWKI